MITTGTARLKALISIAALSFVVVSFQNCAPVHKLGDPRLSNKSDFGSSMPGGASNGSSVAAFSVSLKPLLTTNCSACHGANQSPKFAVTDNQLSHDTLVNSGLVDFITPSNSRVVQKIKGGHNGIGTQVSLDMQNQIAAWVAAITATPGGGVTQDGGGLPVPTPLVANFKSISEKLLIPKCVGCHGATKAEAGVRYDTYALTLKTVLAGSTSQSKLYTEVNSGSMPIGGISRMTASEVSVLAQWINAGALNN